MNDPMGAALDRYITGNYGEDQYRGCCTDESCPDYPNEDDDTCPYGLDKCACDYEARASAEEARWEQDNEF